MCLPFKQERRQASRKPSTNTASNTPAIENSDQEKYTTSSKHKQGPYVRSLFNQADSERGDPFKAPLHDKGGDPPSSTSGAPPSAPIKSMCTILRPESPLYKRYRSPSIFATVRTDGLSSPKALSGKRCTCTGAELRFFGCLVRHRLLGLTAQAA